jgi:tetratricopeptide (TPR) repeat protein
MGFRLGFLLIAGALAVGLALLFTAPDAPEPVPSAAPSGPHVDSTARIDVDVVHTQIPRAVASPAAPGSEAAEQGFAALKAGRDEEALAHFEQAVAAGATGLSLPMSVAYLNLGRTPEALLMARQAVVEEPDRADAWRVLGRLLLDSDDPQGAVDAWEKAQAIDPDPDLEEPLRTARADADARERFLVGESRHFRVRFEGPTDSYLAQRILGILERAYSSVGLTLGYYPDQVIDAVLYTQQDFFDVTRTPGWAGGIFDGTVRLPVAGKEPPAEELERVVTHEYVHAAMVHLLGKAQVPVWLHEGVAMNLEGGDRRKWAAHVRRSHPATVPLARISGSFLGMSRGEADAAYAESYLLVRSLIDRFGPFRLADLLKACRDRPFATAFSDTYRETPDAALARALDDFKAAGNA